MYRFFVYILCLLSCGMAHAQAPENFENFNTVGCQDKDDALELLKVQKHKGAWASPPFLQKLIEEGKCLQGPVTGTLVQEVYILMDVPFNGQRTGYVLEVRFKDTEDHASQTLFIIYLKLERWATLPPHKAAFFFNLTMGTASPTTWPAHTGRKF